MKVKFGAIIVDGRNKVGGHVLSKNRAGSYMRTKVTPVNPQTSYQADARNILGNLSQAWRGLTDEQRQTWNNAVGDYARTDIFGDIKNPSGFNLFVKLNTNRMLFSLAQLDSAPFPQAIPEISITDLSLDLMGPAFALTFSPAVPANTGIKFFITAGQSAGKNFVKSEYRMLTVLPATEVSPYTFEVPYQVRFCLPAEGSKVFAKLVVVNTATGQESPPLFISTDVVDTTP